MKKMLFALVALLTMSASASAMSYEQARREALFLTDKMAYELNLTDAQYEAAYEINLDYLMGVTSVNDVYGPYWERRNLDLSYILYSWQWDMFRAASYFLRPLYWSAGYWHFAIYARYPHRDYYYFGRPHFYATYRGGHSWHMNGGRSYYHGRSNTFRPALASNRQHSGMRDGFNRGDYRGGRLSSSTRVTSGHSRMDGNRSGQGINRPNRDIQGSRSLQGSRGLEGSRGLQGNRSNSGNFSGMRSTNPSRNFSNSPSQSRSANGLNGNSRTTTPSRSLSRGSSSSSRLEGSGLRSGSSSRLGGSGLGSGSTSRRALEGAGTSSSAGSRSYGSYGSGSSSRSLGGSSLGSSSSSSRLGGSDLGGSSSRRSLGGSSRSYSSGSFGGSSSSSSTRSFGGSSSGRSSGSFSGGGSRSMGSSSRGGGGGSSRGGGFSSGRHR